MTNSKDSNPQTNTSNIAIYLLIGILVIVIGIFFINSISKSKQTTIPLSKSGSLTVANARLASSQNALDGKGEFKEEDCNKLKSLSKDFSSTSDFLTSCENPQSLYLSTPDTSERKVLTISDNSYTAKFTFDNNLNNLIDYTFINVASGGFNSSGGRK
jgi:hypothetical protein